MPGPGQHNPPLAPFKTVKYSMAGVKEPGKEKTPGPG